MSSERIGASVHLGYVLGDLPFDDRLALAERLGFAAVEFPFPYDMPATDYRARLIRHGLRHVNIGFPVGDYRSGTDGIATDRDRRSDFAASLQRALAYAETIGCDALHLFSGAPPLGRGRRDAFAIFYDNLSLAAQLAASRGMTILLEPINSVEFPAYLIDTADVATETIAAVGRPNIRLLVDIYHTCAMGLDPLRVLRDHGNLIGHIQLADYPGRHEPGTGSLDFSAMFDAIRDAGYAGLVGLEYVPTRPLAQGVPLIDRLKLHRHRIETINPSQGA